MGYNRAVVTDAEALGMENHSLLYVNGARFVRKTDISRSWLVSARVVGYDTADYGLTNCTPYSPAGGGRQRDGGCHQAQPVCIGGLCAL